VVCVGVGGGVGGGGGWGGGGRIRFVRMAHIHALSYTWLPWHLVSKVHS